jgi:hypothetical protein
VNCLSRDQSFQVCSDKLEMEIMFRVASWNLNSVRSRLTHVTKWLQDREPDVLLLQELKGMEFSFEAFKELSLTIPARVTLP